MNKRDHTWAKWIELDSLYMYETGKNMHSATIRSIGRTREESERTGFVSWITILASQKVPVPNKFKESKWREFLKSKGK